MKKSLKTIDVSFDKETSMIKPKELIEWLGAESLTLTDRRRFNLMLLNAWPDIAEDKIHEIPKASLRGSHKDNEWVDETVNRLMDIKPRVEIEHKGRRFLQLFHILELTETEIDDENQWRGILRYSFSRPFRNVMKNSTQYAQLKKEVIYQMPSKYALALYEIVAKRVNLNKTSEIVDVQTFRAWLGVGDGRLEKFYNFNAKAIKPALAAVNALAVEFECDVEPVKRGQKVVGVQLSWKKKDVAAKAATLKEVSGSKVGRAARISRTVEHIAAPARALAKYGLTTADLEKLREEFGALDFEGTLREHFAGFIRSQSQDPESIPNYALRFGGWLRGKHSPLK
ncbi:MAG: replication initiation protein [Alphaproteobacteria bacterium]|nr:replication initiation protein [Alphaproteobacteria bacterium]